MPSLSICNPLSPFVCIAVPFQIPNLSAQVTLLWQFVPKSLREKKSQPTIIGTPSFLDLQNYRTCLIMAQISPTELLNQLKFLTANPPASLLENTDLRSQLYHAAREAMISLEDAPGPITRVAVAQVYVS